MTKIKPKKVLIDSKEQRQRVKSKEWKGDKDTIKESFDRFKGTKTKSKKYRTNQSIKKKHTNKIQSAYVGSLVTMLVLHANLVTN